MTTENAPVAHRWPCTRFYTSSNERDRCTCAPATPEPDDHEALADVLTDLAATHGDATGTLVSIDAARDAIIAAGFRRHPESVKPSREDVARVLNPVAWRAYDAMMATHPDEPTNPVIVEDSLTKADAVLALWPGRSAAEVKAEELREFAKHLANADDAGDAMVWVPDATAERRGTYVWAPDLARAEADRIERGTRA